MGDPCFKYEVFNMSLRMYCCFQNLMSAGNRYDSKYSCDNIDMTVLVVALYLLSFCCKTYLHFKRVYITFKCHNPSGSHREVTS